MFKNTDFTLEGSLKNADSYINTLFNGKTYWQFKLCCKIINPCASIIYYILYFIQF